MIPYLWYQVIVLICNVLDYFSLLPGVYICLYNVCLSNLYLHKKSNQFFIRRKLNYNLIQNDRMKSNQVTALLSERHQRDLLDLLAEFSAEDIIDYNILGILQCI